MQVRVDNRLRFLAAEAPPWVIERLKDNFTHENPLHAKLRAMGKWPGRVPRFIATWAQEGEEFSLPRGGTGRLRELMREAGDPIKWDVRVCDGMTHDFPHHRVELLPFQEQAVQEILRRQNLIVRSPTGSGKTTIALAVIPRLNRTTIVVVWTGAQLKQWVERIGQELDIPARDVGVIGGGKYLLRPLTVAMQQTLHSYIRNDDPRADEVFRYFGAFIGDELQRWGAETFVQTIDPFSCRYRVGMSADHTRSDHKEFLIHDEFGQLSVDIPYDKLVAEGVIVDVRVVVVPTEFRADWYREAETATDKDFVRLTDQMRNDEGRAALVQHTIEHAASEGAVMVFSHRVEHCQDMDARSVARGLQSGLMLGTSKWSHTFDATKDGLKSGRLRVGIGTFEAIGAAIDIPAVSRGVVATPVNNNRQKFGQVRGRLCRANRGGNADAAIYVLWDWHVFGLKPLANMIAWNKDVVVADPLTWQERDAATALKEYRYAARHGAHY